MKIETIKQNIVLTLVFVVIFSTVAPVSVYAIDFDTVINAAYSVQNTGGQSGQKGADGADGKDGSDGQSGKDGISILNSSLNTASASIQSISDNERVVSILTTKTNGQVEEVYSRSESILEPTNSEVAEVSFESAETVEVVENEDNTSRIQKVLSSIHLIINTYVGIIF